MLAPGTFSHLRVVSFNPSTCSRPIHIPVGRSVWCVGYALGLQTLAAHRRAASAELLEVGPRPVARRPRVAHRQGPARLIRPSRPAWNRHLLPELAGPAPRAHPRAGDTRPRPGTDSAGL